MSAARALLVALEALLALWLVVVLHQDRTWAAYRLLPAASASRELHLQLETDPGGERLRPGVDAVAGRTTLVVYAPPDRRIRLTKNGIAVRELRLMEAAPHRQSIHLRRGSNLIEAELDALPTAPSYESPERAELEVVGRSAAPLHPVIVARVATGYGGTALYGLAEPLWTVELCTTRRGTAVLTQARTDEAGAFVVYVDESDLAPGYRLAGPADPSVGRRDGTAPTPCAPADYTPLTSAAAPLARSLDIDVQAEQFRVKGTVRLPHRSALFDWVIEGDVAPREFVRRIYGLHLGGSTPAEDEDVRGAFTEELMADRSMVQVNFEFTVPRSELWFGVGLVSLMQLPDDRLAVTLAATDTLQVHEPKPARSESGGRVRLSWEQSSDRPGRLLSLPAPAASAPSDRDAASAQRAARDEQTRQTSAYTAVQRLRELLPEHVNDLGYWVVAAIPLLWFGRLLRNTPGLAPDERRRLDGLAVSLLVLHAAYVVVYLFGFDAYRWLAPLARALLPEGDQEPLREAIGDLAHSFPIAVFAGTLLVLRLDRWLPAPAADGQPGKPGFGWLAARVLVVWPLALLVLAGMVGIPFLARWIGPGLELELGQAWRPYLRHAQPLVMALCALAFGWIILHWALRTLVRRGTSVATAWLVSWMLVLLPALPVLADFGAGLLRASLLEHGRSPHLVPMRAADAVWGGLTVLAGVALALALARRVLGVLDPGPAPSRGSWVRRAGLAAALLLLALPMAAGAGTDGAWVLAHFFYFLLQLAPFLLLAGVWRLLRLANPGGGFEYSAHETRIFALLFASYLCGGATNLLLVPIPLLLGYALARQYLLTAERGVPPAGQARSGLLAGLVGLREAQKLQAAFRSHAEKKYAEGALTREQLDKGLTQAKERVAAAARMLPVGQRELRRQVFGFGPESGSLANAAFALRCSVPLVLLFLIAPIDHALQRNVGRYPVLELAVPIVASAGYWLMAAFAFGYFYHRLRGIDGPSKGWAFALAMLLPALCVMVLNRQPLLAISAGEQILRIGLFVFTLALAFDAAVVRRAGFELRQLALVYGIAPSLAFASSLVALGGLSFGPALKVAGCWSLRLLGLEACTP